MNAKKLSLRELEACAAESGKKLLRTFPEMRLAFLHECGKRRINRAFALRDHYPFWKTNDERSKAGKLLLLNRRDEEHIQIMFDDNIGYGSPHIVDARDAETGQPVSFQVSMHAFMPILASMQIETWRHCTKALHVLLQLLFLSRQHMHIAMQATCQSNITSKSTQQTCLLSLVCSAYSQLSMQ